MALVLRNEEPRPSYNLAIWEFKQGTLSHRVAFFESSFDYAPPRMIFSQGRRLRTMHGINATASLYAVMEELIEGRRD